MKRLLANKRLLFPLLAVLLLLIVALHLRSGVQKKTAAVPTATPAKVAMRVFAQLPRHIQARHKAAAVVLAEVRAMRADMAIERRALQRVHAIMHAQQVAAARAAHREVQRRIRPTSLPTATPANIPVQTIAVAPSPSPTRTPVPTSTPLPTATATETPRPTVLVVAVHHAIQHHVATKRVHRVAHRHPHPVRVVAPPTVDPAILEQARAAAQATSVALSRAEALRSATLQSAASLLTATDGYLQSDLDGSDPRPIALATQNVTAVVQSLQALPGNDPALQPALAQLSKAGHYLTGGQYALAAHAVEEAQADLSQA